MGAPSAFGVLVVRVFGAGAFRVVASSVLLASVLGVLGVGALDSVITDSKTASDIIESMQPKALDSGNVCARKPERVAIHLPRAIPSLRNKLAMKEQNLAPRKSCAS